MFLRYKMKIITIFYYIHNVHFENVNIFISKYNIEHIDHYYHHNIDNNLKFTMLIIQIRINRFLF